MVSPKGSCVKQLLWLLGRILSYNVSPCQSNLFLIHIGYIFRNISDWLDSILLKFFCVLFWSYAKNVEQEFNFLFSVAGFHHYLWLISLKFSENVFVTVEVVFPSRKRSRERGRERKHTKIFCFFRTIIRRVLLFYSRKTYLPSFWGKKSLSHLTRKKRFSGQ